ncbi:MAG: DUF370 domain-containing protein [Actinobacteria bacterium]|nr:DUF370 domain-containing protein [Actinomycetota bacterium]
MFLHLGGDVIIRLKDVIAILDLEVAGAPASKEYLQIAKDEGFLVDISEGSPKSFVTTDRKVYLSPISSVTLKKRTAFIRGLGEL